MTPLQAIILGIVQGATEFIPVSSTGHLLLVSRLLSWPIPPLAFDVTLHLGTLLAVLLVFLPDWLKLAGAWLQSLVHRSHDATEARLAWYIILGTVPAALAGYLWEEKFEILFGAPGYAAIFLLVTGTWLALTDSLGRKVKGLADLTWWQALIIGVAQGLAIAPGISRSGATIGTGLLFNQKREAAARFSFLLSAPIIFGAGVLQAKDLIAAPTLAGGLPVLLLGFAAAFVTGYACIRFLLSYLKQHSLLAFAIYCWATGLFALVVLR